MRPSTAALALAITALPALAVAASGVSLRRVAAADGFTMHWLGPERSVSLRRNGLAIVMRPGSPVYDVNSREEIADRAPAATPEGDLRISPRLARRLAALAHGVSTAADAPTGPASRAAVTAGVALAVDARELTGGSALAVEGNAPRNARITLTLLATLAPDLPAVLIERSDVAADAHGHFAAVVPFVSDHLAGRVVVVTASTGANSASARVRIDGAL